MGDKGEQMHCQTKGTNPNINAVILFAIVLTQYSLSQSSQFQISVLESLFHLIVHGLLLALHHDGGAAVEDPLWGSLHHQQVAVVIFILALVN